MKIEYSEERQPQGIPGFDYFGYPITSNTNLLSAKSGAIAWSDYL